MGIIFWSVIPILENGTDLENGKLKTEFGSKIE